MLIHLLHLLALAPQAQATQPPTPGESWLELRQVSEAGRPDLGRVPTREAAGDGAPELAPEDLRHTALASLAWMADGTTMRAGPQKESLKRSILWLRKQYDQKRGSYRVLGTKTEPASVDQALATLALCEAGRLSSYALLRRDVQRGIASLRKFVAASETAPSPELLVWCQAICSSWSGLEAALQKQYPHREFREESSPKELQALIARWTLEAAATDRRQRAALLLLHSLGSAAVPKHLTKDLAQPFTTGSWPTSAEEPRTTLYALLALERLRDRAGFDDEIRKQTRERIRKQIVDRMLNDGELRGSWRLSGPGAAHAGRIETTALNGILTTLYYRSCKLALWTN